MGDLQLILDLDPSMMQALDQLANETGVGSRCVAAQTVLRQWLLATAYLDEDKQLQVMPKDHPPPPTRA